MFLSGKKRGSKKASLLLKLKKMKKGFIEINGIIFDFEDYKEEVRLLKEYTKLDMTEYFSKFDFVILKEKLDYGKMELRFYNKRLDLEVKIKFAKKGKTRFV